MPRSVTRRTLAALLAAAGLAACSTTSTSADGLPPHGAEVDVATFAAAVARPGTTVVDVRTPAEYAQGHLEGAVNLDVESATFRARLAELDPAAPYALYCRSANRSATALSLMREAGFTRVFHLAGGITAWQAAGRPVVR